MNRTHALRVIKETLEQYNRIAPQFDSKRNVSEDFTRLAGLVKPGNLVLDVGCGNGRLVPVLRDSGINLICADGSAELVRIARERYAEDVEKGWVGFVERDALHLPFDGGQFDVIFMMAVLHHIPSHDLRVDLMRDLRAICKRGGLCVGTVWNLRSHEYAKRYNLADVFENPAPGFDPGDVEIPWKTDGAGERRYCHAYTIDELRGIFEEAGWSAIQLYPVNRKHERVSLEESSQLFWEMKS